MVLGNRSTLPENTVAYALKLCFFATSMFPRYSGKTTTISSAAREHHDTISCKYNIMGATTHSIDINAPLRAVYNQWTQFEEFPRFMEGVEEVRQDGPRNLFWKARIAGKEKQWEAEIVEQIPDQRITWQSIDGTPNSGEVTFERLDEERTRVILTM